MFTEWLALKEHNEHLNFVKKQLNGPRKDDRQVQVGIFNSLSTMLGWLSDDRYGMNVPWYIEMVMELEELLPQLKQHPMYRRVAAQIEQMIKLDKMQVGM